MTSIRSRLAKLEAANPGLITDGLARERILARLAAMTPYRPAPSAPGPCGSVAEITSWFAAHGYGISKPEP